MKRSRVILVAVIVIAEALTIVTHPDEAKAVFRAVYFKLWDWAPKPDGFIPPTRF